MFAQRSSKTTTHSTREGYIVLWVFSNHDGKGHATWLSQDFNPKDLRTNPLQGEGVDVEQVSSLCLLSLVRILNQIGPILTLGQELGPFRSILTWDQPMLRKGGRAINSPK